MGYGLSLVIPVVALFTLMDPLIVAAAQATNNFDLNPSTQPAASPDPSDTVYWRKGDPASRPGQAEATMQRQGQFARKDIELGIGAQGFTAWGRDGQDSIVFMTAEISWFPAENFSLGLEAGIAPGTLRFGTKRRDEQQNFTGDDSSDDNTTYSLRMRASEGIAIARYHFLIERNFSFFVDGGLGILHASNYFPDGGRSDNWLATTGLGLDLRIADECYLQLGGRFARLSGGNLFAPRQARDASDGVQYYGGFSLVW
jgi:hypothetical protein